MLALESALGPIPDNIFQKWDRSSLYYRTDETLGKRTLFCANLGGQDEVPNGEEPYVPEPRPMEKLFDDAAPNLANSREGIRISVLIRKILQYDPAKRPTVAEILQDPWFTRNDWESDAANDPGYELDAGKERNFGIENDLDENNVEHEDEGYFDDENDEDDENDDEEGDNSDGSN